MWLRALADYTISVIRQHREQKSRGDEALSLRNLLQQWLALGGGLVSVTVLSMRYALQVILRRPLRSCVVASTIILLLWVWSIFKDLGQFNLARNLPLPIYGLVLKIHNGVFEFRHIYPTDEPDLFPERFRQETTTYRSQVQVWERFRQNPKYQNQLTPSKPWEFSFSSGYWICIDFKPFQYSLLRIPVPALFIFVVLFYAGTRCLRGNRVSGPARQSA